jgi:microcin C transport system substrate-binding protein
MEAEGLPTPGELALLEPLAGSLPPGVLDQPAYTPAPTDGSGRNREALRAAAGLLDEAGWTVRDGVRQKDGERLEFEFLLVGEGFERITVPYVRNLERIGALGTVRTIDPSQYKNRMDAFDFDITVSRKAMSLTPGVELKDYFHSSSANSPGSSNTAGLADPAVDALIDVIERATDRDLLTSAVKALDRVMRAMHIWVPQWHKGSHTIAYWDIYDRPALKPEFQRGVNDLWWIDAERHARLKAQVGG